MQRKIITTADNSHTLFVPELNEHYHSIHGALQESRHVFIEAGFKQVLNEEVKILEVGFGTGLNAVLTAIEAEETGRKTVYHTLEAYPVEAELLEQLNYTTLLPKKHAPAFKTIHDAPWEKEVEISSPFSIKKIKSTVQQWKPENQYDLVYFDAFAPEKQPEMWTEAVFQKMYAALKPNGFLVTYCAKGSAKRAMKAAGFKVEALPGPPGKREMTKAVRMDA